MSTSTSSIESSATRRVFHRPTKVFKGHTRFVGSVAYFSDGPRIASASYDKTIIIWDIESGMQDGQPLQHDSVVRCIAISPDGRRIVSGMEEGGLVVWDALTREVVHEIKGDGVIRLAYSPDGRWIVTAPMANERVVRLWDADTGRPGREPLKCDGDVFCVAFSPDGSRIAVGCDDGCFQVLDISTGMSVVGPIKGHKRLVSSVVYSPDGRLVTGSVDQSIRVWDSKTGIQVGKPMLGREDEVNCISISADGRRIASVGHDETIRVWDLETRLQVDSFDTPEWVNSVAFSADGRYIISGGYGDSVSLWDTESFATQGSSSPSTASNQHPPVRDRAHSVTSSILDLPAVPEPVLSHEDDHSPSEFQSSRGSSFDSILDLPAVLEPGKRRPKKKWPHRLAARIENDLPPSPVATAVPLAELETGALGSPRTSKVATDEIQAGPSGQNATNAGLNTFRSRQRAFARLIARFSGPFRRQTPRSPETRKMQPTTSNQDTAPIQPAASGHRWSRNIRERWRRIRPPKSRVPTDIPDRSPHPPPDEQPIAPSTQAPHARIRPSRNRDEGCPPIAANVALGKLDERLYAAPPRDINERRRWRARERRRAARNHDSGSEPEDNDAESYYENTGCLDAFCFLECFRWWRHSHSR